jgi:hypothetical protein
MRKVREGKLADDQRLFNSKRKPKVLTFIADITAKVTSDRHVTVGKLAQAHGLLTKTIHATLHKDLNCLSLEDGSLSF